jgi:hypothetical protein
MADLTNKNLDFLPDTKLITILRSVLKEIDIVASSGAHRSTTYLAVSAIEGLFRELLKLLKIDSTSVTAGIWPTVDGKPKKADKLDLADLEKILIDAQALPEEFNKLYSVVRTFRNDIHPALELEDLKSINQSIGQLALACLNALIEKYEFQRFIATERWRLEYGLAQVPGANAIHMPQQPGEFKSLLISELPATDFREVSFRLTISPGAIFNFVYNYFSRDKFMAARIEGREQVNGKGLDNGRLVCKKWEAWVITDKYTDKTEPKTHLREHSVQVFLGQLETFSVIVDGEQLILEGENNWHFLPKGKLTSVLDKGGHLSEKR